MLPNLFNGILVFSLSTFHLTFNCIFVYNSIVNSNISTRLSSISHRLIYFRLIFVSN